MLKPLSETELHEAVLLSAELLTASASRSYPFFQSKSDIEAEYRLRLRDPHGALLGYYRQDRLIGVLCYFYEPGELYLQTTAMLAQEAQEDVFAAFLTHLHEGFPGYTALIGLSADNQSAVITLSTHGFCLIESSHDMRLQRQAFVASRQSGVGIHRITSNNFDAYAAFHDACYGDNTYWKAARLYAHLDAWHIFAYAIGDMMRGSVFLKIQERMHMAEVFGMTFQAKEDAKRAAFPLLSHAVQSVFDDNAAIDSIIFFVEDGDDDILQAAYEAGFACLDRYRCFEASL